MNRETVYSTLFSKLQAATAGSIKTSSRILRHWNDVEPADMPALFQAQKNQHPTQKPALPAVWTLPVELYLYVSAPDDQTPPATQLNNLLDAIEAVLKPAPGQDYCTLGLDNVHHAWINGEVTTDEGTLGNLAVAIIPVEILVKY